MVGITSPSEGRRCVSILVHTEAAATPIRMTCSSGSQGGTRVRAKPVGGMEIALEAPVRRPGQTTYGVSTAATPEAILLFLVGGPGRHSRSLRQRGGCGTGHVQWYCTHA
jgi:hypothetical protein